jgi:ABC-2 type transport system ATP-binding protein
MIRLERFEKRYGKIHAVKPLDLEVERGETFALLGPNGSGKTSIIRALVGLHKPTAGRILIDGIDIVKSPNRVKRRLSYVPQRVSMPEMLTAREILTLFGRLKDVPDGRIDEVLDLFALVDDADRQAREFSGGMLQRLGLAAAFLEDVALFVLDEPTVNLDLLGVDRLRNLLGELKGKGTTIVFSSHLLQSAMQLADRVGVLVEGELVELEEAPAFRAAVTHQTVIRVVVSEASDAVIAAARGAGAEVSRHNAKQVLFRAVPEHRLAIIRAIERAGATIEEFHTESPDWESLVRRHFGAEEPSP